MTWANCLVCPGCWCTCQTGTRDLGSYLSDPHQISLWVASATQQLQWASFAPSTRDSRWDKKGQGKPSAFLQESKFPRRICLLSTCLWKLNHSQEENLDKSSHFSLTSIPLWHSKTTTGKKNASLQTILATSSKYHLTPPIISNNMDGSGINALWKQPVTEGCVMPLKWCTQSSQSQKQQGNGPGHGLGNGNSEELLYTCSVIQCYRCIQCISGTSTC